MICSDTVLYSCISFYQMCQISEVSCHLNSKYKCLTRCGHTGAWGILRVNVLKAARLSHLFSFPDSLFCSVSFLCLKYRKWFSKTSERASGWWNVQILKHLGLCVRVQGMIVCTPEVLLHWFDKIRFTVWPLLRMQRAFSDTRAECVLVRFYEKKKKYSITFSLQMAFSHCVKKRTISVYWTQRFFFVRWKKKNPEERKKLKWNFWRRKKTTLSISL